MLIIYYLLAFIFEDIFFYDVLTYIFFRHYDIIT